MSIKRRECIILISDLLDGIKYDLMIIALFTYGAGANFLLLSSGTFNFKNKSPG